MNFFTDPINFIINWLRSVLAGWGWSNDVSTFVLYLLGALILATVPLLITIGLIWLERKLLGRVQDRLGPNRVGPWGIFQPIADMLKIFTKELITPEGADVIPYNMAPILAVGAVLMIWAVIPLALTTYGVNLNVGVLYMIAVGALADLAIVLAGWGSNNKYALLGAFRAVAQLLSYEVPLVISLLVPVMLAGTLNLNEIVRSQEVWFILLAPVSAFIFLTASIAENGRAPFDLLEAESEIVSGFNIEYSGLKFGFFYVGDFLHTFTIALLFATLFLGGWRGPGAEQYPILGFVWLILKSAIPYGIIILLRGSLPRFRIDQMLDLNWKVLTPLSLVMVIVTALADKALPENNVWLRAGLLFTANVLVWLMMSYILSVRTSRRPRRVVATTIRPVARPPQEIAEEPPAESPAQSDTGV